MGAVLKLSTGQRMLVDEAGAPTILQVEERLLHTDVALKHAINELEATALIDDIFFTWPNIRDTTMSLACLLSAYFPGQEGSLLSEVIGDCLEAYTENLDKRDEGKPMRAYLRKLVVKADRVVSYNVSCCNEGGRILWEPFSEPLCLWLHKNKATEVHFQPHERFKDDGSAARVLMLSRLLPIGQFALLGPLNEIIGI